MFSVDINYEFTTSTFGFKTTMETMIFISPLSKLEVLA